MLTHHAASGTRLDIGMATVRSDKLISHSRPLASVRVRRQAKAKLGSVNFRICSLGVLQSWYPAMPSTFIKNPVVWFAVILAVAIGGGFYFWKARTDREARLEQLPQQQQPEVAQATPPSASADSEVDHPLPAPQPQAPGTERKPLPPLNESDEALREALAAPLGREALHDIVMRKDIARRFVVTIDNLPRKKLAERLLPLKPPSGHFLANGQGEIATLATANYARYDRYVKFATALDAQQVVALYVEYYPVFQQAYRDLGY